jgi:hypothetical protein
MRQAGGVYCFTPLSGLDPAPHKSENPVLL